MIESKLPQVGTTIFTVMSKLAAEHGAINLSQGFPDFQPPPALTEKVAQALADGRNQYAPMAGLEALRESISRLVGSCYGVTVDPADEITITSGATEALFAAIQATVRIGDEVIVFDPCYDSYVPAIELAGGTPVRLPLHPRSFAVDWQRFAEALSSRTRLVVINSPHNPSGTLLSREDLDRLAELIRNRHCFVLSDEVYEHVTFDGRRHQTVVAHEELAERAFAVSSFGKTYHATGWKVGYCIAPRPLSAELRKIHQYVTFATSTPMQYAIAEYLQEAPSHYRELGEFFAKRRDYFANGIAATAFEPLNCQGTYFQLADYSAISELPDVDFCRWLTLEHGVAAIPISVFYANPPPDQRIVRFCFAKEDDTLDQAIQRLGAV
ncbi:MAG: pyridoxal phosphate-dependent aminotransferase [Gammaproteobacteria bacterium]